jgi:hypothetical protein
MWWKHIRSIVRRICLKITQLKHTTLACINSNSQDFLNGFRNRINWIIGISIKSHALPKWLNTVTIKTTSETIGITEIRPTVFTMICRFRSCLTKRYLSVAYIQLIRNRKPITRILNEKKYGQTCSNHNCLLVM